VVASRAFHDQDIDFLFRKDRCFHDRLIVEIDVPGVKDRFTFRSQKNSTRAQHVSCVEKLESQCVFLALGRTLAGNRDTLTQWAPMPAFRRAIGFSMREKRI
jgi:hypothetical protein